MRRTWTKDEIMFLKTNEGKLDNEELSFILKRTISSIKQKQYQLKNDEIFSRVCPTCGDEIRYKTKGGYTIGLKKNSICRNCATKEVRDRPENKKIHSEKWSGENNPGYGGKIWKGRKHSDETKQKQRNRNTEYTQTNEFKVACKKARDKFLNDNPEWTQPNNYDIWLSKSGKTAADERLIVFKEKLSVKMSGEGNPMFGKPAPIGSGNGIGGWYGEFYFRSLRELQFILVMERFKYKIVSGESKKNKVIYEYKGIKRNYFPDFIINDKFMVEIKPTKLRQTDVNLIKTNFAEEHCKKLGLTYKLLDFGIPTQGKLNELHKNGKIIFNKNSELKFITYEKK